MFERYTLGMLFLGFIATLAKTKRVIPCSRLCKRALEVLHDTGPEFTARSMPWEQTNQIASHQIHKRPQTTSGGAYLVRPLHAIIIYLSPQPYAPNPRHAYLVRPLEGIFVYLSSRSCHMQECQGDTVKSLMVFPSHEGLPLLKVYPTVSGRLPQKAHTIHDTFEACG